MSKLNAKAVENALIAYASTFPQAWEDHPWEHTVLKVGKKVFVFFGGAAGPPDELSMTVKLPVSYEMALTLPYVSPGWPRPLEGRLGERAPGRRRGDRRQYAQGVDRAELPRGRIEEAGQAV